MSRACCFTGHRALPPLGSPPYSALAHALQTAVSDAIQLGCTDFFAGGATGFDLLASELILHMQTSNPTLTLTICAPYLGHDNAFSAQDRFRYRRMRDRAERVIYLSDRYTRGCFLERNRYMVEHSDLCIAYVRKRPSGSAQTLRLAERQGLTILLV